MLKYLIVTPKGKKQTEMLTLGPRDIIKSEIGCRFVYLVHLSLTAAMDSMKPV